MADNHSPFRMQKNFSPIRRNHRRESNLTSSDARTALLPIDCVLVYSNRHESDEKENAHRFMMSRAERRRRFEDYLENKQGLILQHFVCIREKKKKF